MKIYTIDADENITAFPSAKEAGGAGERFSSAKELAKLAEGWPIARLVAIWNSLPGGEPVKRFQSRQAAVTRIWAAIQSLVPSLPPETPTVAPARASRDKKAAALAEPPIARDSSKKAAVLALIRRPGGATLAEIMTATDWQPHSVRGFLSGAIGKRMGLTVESFKSPQGERAYRVAS